MNPASSYAQNSGSSAAYPYPQGHALPHCAFPAYNTDTVETAYTNWKTKFFVNGNKGSFADVKNGLHVDVKSHSGVDADRVDIVP